MKIEDKFLYIKPKLRFFKLFLKRFWYIPSDILQRGIEASIWSNYDFYNPSLDIGIGNGEMTKVLFKKNYLFSVGIDNEDQGFYLAKSYGQYKKILKVNAEKMPFPNESFRTIVSNSTFEHISYDLKAIAEVSRVLRKNGEFYFCVPNNFFPEFIKKIEKQKTSSEQKNKLELINNRLNHFHYRSLHEWDKIFTKNKMEIVNYTYYMPYESFKIWYRLLNVFTKKYRQRELWSYLGHSKFSFIAKPFLSFIVRFFLMNIFLKSICKKGQVGAQLFMVVRKK